LAGAVVVTAVVEAGVVELAVEGFVAATMVVVDEGVADVVTDAVAVVDAVASLPFWVFELEHAEATSMRMHAAAETLATECARRLMVLRLAS
jgi:hypothetical protein